MDDRRNGGYYMGPSGPGSSLFEHPLLPQISMMLSAGLRPPWIARILAVQYGGAVRQGALPAIPSVRTLQRYVRYHVRDSQLAGPALLQRIRQEHRQELQELERGRTSGENGAGSDSDHPPASSPVATGVTDLARKRQQQLARLGAEKQRRLLAELALAELGRRGVSR